MPDNTLTLATLLDQERGKLRDFVDEAEKMFDQLQIKLRIRANDTFQEILRNNLPQFAQALEIAIDKILSETLSKSLSDASGPLSQTRTQEGAALLKLLEHAKRNI